MAFKKGHVPTNKKATTKAAVLDEAAQTAVLEVASKLTAKPDETLKMLTDIQLKLGDRIADIQQTLAVSIKQSADLDQAIELKKDQLKQWGEVTELTLMLDFLRAEIENTRTLWESERTARDESWSLVDEERDTAQTREETLYVIERDAKRREEEATYDAARKALKLTHTDEDLGRDRAYKARLSDLAEREKVLEDLKAKVAGIDVLVDAAVKKAEATLKGVLTNQFAHERALAEKDVLTAKALSDAKIRALEETVTRLEKSNTALAAQAELANQKVAEMAAQVAQAASGSSALRAVQETVQSQNASTTGKR